MTFSVAEQYKDGGFSNDLSINAYESAKSKNNIGNNCYEHSVSYQDQS